MLLCPYIRYLNAIGTPQNIAIQRNVSELPEIYPSPVIDLRHPYCHAPLS